MATTFYFYDLETSGISPKDSRIMQFAGQRTDLQLQPIDEPHNEYIRLTEEILPDPDAVLITGITPQKTIADGLTEAEFLRLFYEDIATPDTIFVGFNTIRFDDEFMRYLMYRNFYDPYEWQWQEGRSRWDLLDVVRMTRALRPDGITWPFDTKGNPTNRLELITSLNGIGHDNAHDALSDVRATIAVAQLIRGKQPKLFDYLLQIRDKKAVSQLVHSGKPFLYSSGKYAAEYEKTAAVGLLADHPQGQSALVFDLRYNPEEFLNMEPAALAEAMRRRRDNPGPRLPVKTIKFNRCPAIAPLSVLDTASQERLQLDPNVFEKHFQILQRVKESLGKKVVEALGLLDKAFQTKLLEQDADVDTRLYDGFFAGQDKTQMRVVRAASQDTIGSLEPGFADDRLNAMFPLYKARNFSKSLSDDERVTWESFREQRLLGGEKSRAVRYFERLSELASQTNLSAEKRYLLEELQLYGQSILPQADDF